MAQITQEMRAKLLHAKDQEEVRSILGPEAAEEEIERVWQEIQRHRPAEGLEAVEDDELEAVSGGYERDYGAQGCSATVEDGSHCWTDDKCTWWQVEYVNYDPCPKGGNHDWKCCCDNIPDWTTQAPLEYVQVKYLWGCRKCNLGKYFFADGPKTK